ncbi:MAG: THUMP domain-containing protein [Candidatus Methanomethylicaceae archaeon]
MNKAVIVRMGGEIGIKSKNVRRIYENKVINNIMKILKRNNISFSKILKYPGRVYLFTEENEKAAELIAKIFGVYSTSTCFVLSSDMKEIIDKTLEIVLTKLKPGTFAIRCRRTGSHSYKSKDIEVVLGRAILEKRSDLKVNLENPDQVINIEIRDEYAYVYFDSIKGPDGFPLGTQNPLIGIINETKESVIASWCVMRRGVEIKVLICGEFSENIKSNIKHLLQWIPNGIIEVYKVNTECKSRIFEILAAIKLAKIEKIDGIVSGIRNIDIELIKKLLRFNVSIFFPLIALEDEMIRDWCKYLSLGEYVINKELIKEDLKEISLEEEINYEIIKFPYS